MKKSYEKNLSWFISFLTLAQTQNLNFPKVVYKTPVKMSSEEIM